jgi:hypothetical protein
MGSNHLPKACSKAPTPMPQPRTVHHLKATVLVELVSSVGCDKTWIPDLPKGSDNYRFGWIRDTPIRLQIQEMNPATLAPRILWLSAELLLD